MKKLIFLFLFLIPTFIYSQIDYNIYIGSTKKDIIKTFKYDSVKYNFEQKLYVDIDSTGNWFISENHYTWLVYFDESRGLFTFDKKTGRCDKYYILCDNLNDYWVYFDYYNDVFVKTKQLTWIEKKHNYYNEIKLRALNPKNFEIFIKKFVY